MSRSPSSPGGRHGKHRPHPSAMLGAILVSHLLPPLLTIVPGLAEAPPIETVAVGLWLLYIGFVAIDRCVPVPVPGRTAYDPSRAHRLLHVAAALYVESGTTGSWRLLWSSSSSSSLAMELSAHVHNFLWLCIVDTLVLLARKPRVGNHPIEQLHHALVWMDRWALLGLLVHEQWPIVEWTLSLWYTQLFLSVFAVLQSIGTREGCLDPPLSRSVSQWVHYVGTIVLLTRLLFWTSQHFVRFDVQDAMMVLRKPPDSADWSILVWRLGMLLVQHVHYQTHLPPDAPIKRA